MRRRIAISPLTIDRDNATVAPMDIPPVIHRYVTLTALRRMHVGDRLDLNEHTYILRKNNGYVAYRNWMSSIALIEVFQLRQETALLNWLEQAGYTFGVSSDTMIRAITAGSRVEALLQPVSCVSNSTISMPLPITPGTLG